MKYIAAMILLLLSLQQTHAQDPAFSQFFATPLNINPSLAGRINADWRLISNVRDQWIGPASPYVTGTVSFDSKVMQNKVMNVDEEGNVMGVGGMLLFDNAMMGVVKSVYGSANLSYNIKLSDDGYRTHRLGLGFGAMYGRRFMDFSRVDFEEQFTGWGFNTNLPTGETALSNMKPYLSVSTGAVYSYTTEFSNFDIGVAAFHVNKPKQTFLQDQNQVLPVRKVAHANFETFVNDRVVFNANGIYQFQKEAKYFSAGAALGYLVGDENETMLMGGMWYWSENALIPYLGIAYKNLQVGATYDLTTSKLNQAARRPNTWEISFILRGTRSASKVIPCPWK